MADDTLAARVRAKYPGAYDDLDDATLERQVRAKYPGVYDDLPSSPAQFKTSNERDAAGNPVIRAPLTSGSPAQIRTALQDTPVGQDLQSLKDVGTGILKGAGQTFVNLGDLVHKIPGVSTAIDALYGTPGLSQTAFRQAQQVVAPTSTAQAIGKGAEQIGEMLVPGTKVAAATRGLSLLPRVAAEGALGGGMAIVQHTSPTVGAVTGAAGPVVGLVANPVSDYLANTAVGAMRAGLKTPLSILKQQAGVQTEGLDFAATRLAKFMVDNRLATVGQATRLVKNAEADVQQVLAANPGAVTDAPARVMQYVDRFKQRAAKTLSPDQANAVSAYADELLQQSVLGQDVTQTVMRPSPTGIVDASGQVVQVPTPVSTRALRPDLPATDALNTARETSQFQTGRQWGEQKGVVMEATKTAERAVRDAVKDALPDIRTPLQQEGMAILAKQVLDRRMLMEANRDVISLPGLVGANAHAVLGLAAQFLRTNQRRAGIWAAQLSDAIVGQDAATAAAILHRLGVGAVGQLTADPGAAVPVPAP